VVVGRNGYRLDRFALRDGRCACGARVPGVWEDTPGAWGPRRQPVRIGAVA